MTVLKNGVPFETVDPIIKVEIDPANPLSVGRHRFTLAVVDDSGNISDTVDAIVLVVDSTRPNAVLFGPSQIEFGLGFELNAQKSFDVGGKIVKYIFTLMD